MFCFGYHSPFFIADFMFISNFLYERCPKDAILYMVQVIIFQFIDLFGNKIILLTV